MMSFVCLFIIKDMKLRVDIDKILEEGLPNYDIRADSEVIDLGKRIQEKGFSNLDEFRILSDWKSPRIRKHILSNGEETIQEVTKDVLSTKSELTHIGSLLLLKGVSYPMASTFLHLCHETKYPIIDYRALWTLGFDELPKYDINFWLSYVNYTRDLADKYNLDMRTLDRALWGYSKKYQK